MTTEDEQAVESIYTQYRSYLLRLWQETPHAAWRASLQDAATGERLGFADLDSLFTFLRDIELSDHAGHQT